MGVKVGDAKCKSNNFQSLWCCGFHSNPGWQMNPTFKSQDSPNVYCNSSIAKNLKILPVSGRKKCENYSYLVTSSTFVFPSFKWVLMNIFHSGMLRVAIKKVTRWRLDIFFFLQQLIDYSHVRKSLDLSGSVMVSLFRPIKLFRGPWNLRLFPPLCLRRKRKIYRICNGQSLTNMNLTRTMKLSTLGSFSLSRV